MACFLVPAAEAVIVKAVEKGKEKQEQPSLQEASSESTPARIPLSRKLKWLSRLLVGGSVLLAFEHIWHGEIVAWFPFLSAMADPADKMEMLHEMATVGVGMAALITAVWIVMCIAADALVKRPFVPIVSETKKIGG